MFRLTRCIWVLCLLTLPATVSAEKFQDIDWERLAAPTPPEIQKQMDELYNLDPEDPITDEEYEAKWKALEEKAYPVEEAMDGKMIRIPGFVVPLDLEADVVSEFLLVPYLGACIHVPPPPPNQVVYVKSSNEYTIEDLYDPVWVTGRINVASMSTDLAESGYVLNADEIIKYIVD